MTICSNIILFALCSVFGWVYESCYAITQKKHWERRGFLYGPACPIYGVGVVIIILATKDFFHLIGMDFRWYHVALVSFFGSMILEYVTSWAMEKLFHAYWWDYSTMPLNFNGRTCVPAGCLFAAGGLFAVYVISPAWDAVVAVTPFVVLQLLAFAVVILFTIDATLTVSALTNFQKQVVQTDKLFHQRASEITEKMISAHPDLADKVAGVGPAAVELFNHIPELADALHDEMDKLQDLRVQALLDGMSSPTKSAVGRVKGFRLPKTYHQAALPVKHNAPAAVDRAHAKVKHYRRYL